MIYIVYCISFFKSCEPGAGEVVRRSLLADAYLAAVAIEHECEPITPDSDFARFAGCAGDIVASVNESSANARR